MGMRRRTEDWHGRGGRQVRQLGQGMGMRMRVGMLVEDGGAGGRIEHAEGDLAMGRQGRQGEVVLRRSGDRAGDGDVVVKGGKMGVLVVRLRVRCRAAWQSMNQKAGRRLELSRRRVHIFSF